MSRVKVEPTPARFLTERTTAGLRITLRRGWTLQRGLIVGFTTIWLGGWLAGEVAAIGSLFGKDWLDAGSEDTAFVAVWLVFWTVGGALIWYAWLWNVAGREWIDRGAGALVVGRKVGPYVREREFDLAHVSDLRATQPGGWAQWYGLGAFGIGGGTIAFDYGSKTIRFGDGIDEAEAKQVVAALERSAA